MVTLGITGGIGSGKTYVARLMEHSGVPVYYTDTEARRLMNTDAGIREALTRLVGADAYFQGGGLNQSLCSRLSVFRPAACPMGEWNRTSGCAS